MTVHTLNEQRLRSPARRQRGHSHRRPGLHVPAVDAVVVGGGPAGLSAGLVLGRARRRVMVVDAGRPANTMVEDLGGLLAQSGVSPLQLRASGRKQLAEHTNVEIHDDAVIAVNRLGDGFAVKRADGGPVRTRPLVLAHGLRYDPPPLPGIDKLWARSVFHCPFCDGWEVRDGALAVHGNGPEAARSALFVSAWSDDVVLCTDGPARLNGEGELLAAAGVRVREEPIRKLAGTGGRLRRIEFSAGPHEQRDALFVRTQRALPNRLAAALGCAVTEAGTIEVDGDGRTSVGGVYAAGDAATEHSRSVASAIGSGSRVAYAATLDLVA